MPTSSRRRVHGHARLVLTLLLIAAFLAVLLPPMPSAVAATCPCSIWSGSVVPGTPADPDTAAVELGVKFRADTAGFVTGLRFYKGAGNTGTHVGHLWTNTGTQLAAATFTGETASGWQQVSFASPVAVTANTTYVASYSRPMATARPMTTSLGLGWTTRPCMPWPTGWMAPTGCTATIRAGSRPTRSGRPTTGSTWSSTRPRPTPSRHR